MEIHIQESFLMLKAIGPEPSRLQMYEDSLKDGFGRRVTKVAMRFAVGGGLTYGTGKGYILR